MDDNTGCPPPPATRSYELHGHDPEVQAISACVQIIQDLCSIHRYDGYSELVNQSARNVARYLYERFGDLPSNQNVGVNNSGSYNISYKDLI